MNNFILKFFAVPDCQSAATTTARLVLLRAGPVLQVPLVSLAMVLCLVIEISRCSFNEILQNSNPQCSKSKAFAQKVMSSRQSKQRQILYALTISECLFHPLPPPHPPPAHQKLRDFSAGEMIFGVWGVDSKSILLV